MSRYIRLAENGNLPRNNAPRLSTASSGMTSTERGACCASSDSCLHPVSLYAAGAPWWLVAGRLGASEAGEDVVASPGAAADCWRWDGMWSCRIIMDRTDARREAG